ncbi:site-specific integrase [Mycobacterium malmoense]|nr:site-specific integrase [Mycobacterium malmoense]
MSSKSAFWAYVRARPRKTGGITYAVYYTVNGRQTSIPFPTEQLAEDFRRAIKIHGVPRVLEMYDINPAPRRGAHKRSAGPTVVEWVRRHIDGLTGVEQYTLDVYNRYLANDITPFFADMPLAALTADDMGAWVKHMESTPSAKTKRLPTPKTIRNKYGFLSGALGAAAARGLIAANPAAGRRLPRSTGTHDGDDMRMLSRAEFDRLLAATPEYWRTLLEFLVASGCRWGEATALRPSDIDQTAGTVKIRRAWKYSTKGYQIGPPKTARSKRTINLAATLLAKLDYTHEWLFVNQRGNPVRYHSFKPNVWDKAVAKAELDPKPTPHDLRHTCASWLLGAGVPILTVSRRLGHESVKMTGDVYGDVDRTSHQAAADIMGRLLE